MYVTFKKYIQKKHVTIIFAFMPDINIFLFSVILLVVFLNYTHYFAHTLTSTLFITEKA